MRLCRTALALMVGCLSLAGAQVVLAQEAVSPGTGQPSTPSTNGSASDLELAPNPFRTPSPLETQIGQPGFAEASDLDLFAPAAPNNRSTNNAPSGNAPSGNRRPTPTPVSTSQNSTSNSNPFSPRLARAPFVLGDSLAPSLQYTYLDSFDHSPYVSQLPTAGGATRRRIAENTGAFPTDRLIFNYNNFHNGVESFDEATNIDRFTLGIEKAFLSNLFSIDVRFPLTANNDVANANFSRNGSEVGNLSVALKLLLTSDQDSAIVAGMVIDTPTGGGTEASLFGDTYLRLDNDALYLAPFLGFLCLHDGGIAQQGFIQVDVPTNGNGLTFSDASPAVITTEFTEQTLLYIDYSVSKPIYTGRRSNRGQNKIAKISALAEFHYTTTLEDSDQILINTTLNNNFSLSSTGNRIDVLNFTLGVDTALACGAHMRLGTVVPLNDGDDRFFDIEFLAQLNIPL